MLNQSMAQIQTQAATNPPAYVEISTHETLLQLSPAFVRSLAHELAVLSLRGRVCPVCFSDGSVGVFALLEYCYDDQTRAVLDLLRRRGLRLNQPQLFVLPPALLLAIDKSAGEQSVASAGVHNDRQAQQGALSAAFDALLRWGSCVRQVTFTLTSIAIAIPHPFSLRLRAATCHRQSSQAYRHQPFSICSQLRGWILREATARCLIR